MIAVWTGFIGFVLILLALDLGVFHRRAHVVSLRESLLWSSVWIALGLAFTAFVYFGYGGGWMGLGAQADPVDGLVNTGASAALKYFTGYVVEKSLSVDNIFVIAIIFASFAVPALYQHRVLFWGILGALAMRGAMIAIGARLIAEFHWVLTIFGVLLLATGARMLFMKAGHGDPGRNPVVRLARRLFPVTDRYHGSRFVVRAGLPAAGSGAAAGEESAGDPVVASAAPGTLLLTPLALALLVVETTDLIFAVDSIPAIFAITADPFLVFTSNVFAILGLRSLYFALAGIIHRFRYMKTALALVLVLVGVKMLTAKWLKAAVGERFNYYVLAVVLLVLAAGIVASLAAPPGEKRPEPPDRSGAR